MNSDLLNIGRRTIQKEAEALVSFEKQLGESFEKACELLFECNGTTLLTGMGKSGLVARKWASTLSSTGTKSYFINPAEAQHGDLGIIHPADVLVALSYSGETSELESVLKHAINIGVPIVAVTGNPESSLSKKATVTLELNVSEEACPLNLAPTTSTTLMMALGDAVAVTLMQLRGFKEEDFAQLHPGGSLGRRLWLKVADIMHAGPEVPVVKPDASFSNVLLEMTEKRLGLAVVVGDTILGIITDGDLRRFFQQGGDATKVVAKEMMTRGPKVIGANALAMDARNRMEKNKIQHLLVVDKDEKLLGVLHFHDLLSARVV